MSIRELTYRVLKPDKFDSDDLVEYAEATGAFTLARGLLRAQLKAPAGSVSEARERVDPIVRSWEFEAEVRMGFPVIHFEFVPVVPVETVPACSPASSDATEGEPELLILWRYPPGPTIRVNAEMENIWARYDRARLGFAESIQSAVYYGLTVLEAQFGSRSKASAALNLAPEILSKMGELTSTRGDLHTARKARAASVPLSREEKWWLDSAVRHSLLQLGHLVAGLSPQPVSITDLPI